MNETEVIASEGEAIVEKTNKDNTKQAIMDGVCNYIILTNHTPNKGDIIVNLLGTLGKKRFK